MNEGDLMKICEGVLEVYPDKVSNYKLGEIGLLGLFTGEVMKKSKGTADPKKIVTCLKILLK